MKCLSRGIYHILIGFESLEYMNESGLVQNNKNALMTPSDPNGGYGFKKEEGFLKWNRGNGLSGKGLVSLLRLQQQ